MDYSEEIKMLKSEIESIKSIIEEIKKSTTNEEKKQYDNELTFVKPMHNMHPDIKFSEIMDELCEKTDRNQTTGMIAYLGVFTSGGRQSNWIQNGLDTDDLLKLVDNKSASAVLQSIGNNDRLNLLINLLREPMSVAKMVEKCCFNSTGQAYHHLKPLIAADIISETENERGVYAVKFHRVQGIIMLLSGIFDLINPKYSKGIWEE